MTENSKIKLPDLTDKEFCGVKNNILSGRTVKHAELKFELEHYFGISFSAISKRYKRCKKETIFATHDKIRARNAKRLLNRKCCYQVQYELGFKNESYFSKWFRKHTGKNPSGYQRLNA
jgi:YesN/AraC family two-component response regulator